MTVIKIRKMQKNSNFKIWHELIKFIINKNSKYIQFKNFICFKKI